MTGKLELPLTKLCDITKILEFALKPKEVLLEIFANVDPYSLGHLNRFEIMRF